MIIYFYNYLLIIFVGFLNSNFAETSSIRSRAFKNDLLPFAGTKTDLSKRDENSLKIVSNEPFIIQLATANSPKKDFLKEKKEAANKKRPKIIKKRLPKLKAIKKRHRTRRDAHTTGLKGFKPAAFKNYKKVEPKQNPVTDDRSVDTITEPVARLENLISRQKMFEAIDEALKSKGKNKESRRDEPFSWETTISTEESTEEDDFKDWVKKPDTVKSKPENRLRSLVSDSPIVGMFNPLNLKKTDKHHPRELSQNLERLDRKISNIKKLLGGNDLESGFGTDGIRVRRKTELDRSANKIAKMFLTLSAINGKRKSKCMEDDYEDDYDEYDDDSKALAIKKTPLSNNEERYKVKKWIEHLKSRRSNRYCPCSGYNGGEEDAFPLDEKVSKAPMMHEIGSDSEESAETDMKKDKGFFSKYGYTPRSRNSQNKNRYAKVNNEIDEKLKALRNRKKKLDLPLDDLEMYRSRAKKILQNAEDILEKIKEEEEKRATKPDYLMNRLKELTSRIHANPRNDNNDFMRLIQKNFGLDTLHKVHTEEDGDSLGDAIKAYFTDPYEKAKQLTEESAKQLSTFMLQNLAKLGGETENVKEELKNADEETPNAKKIPKGRPTQSNGKYIPNGLISGKSDNFKFDSDVKDSEDSTQVQKSKQELEDAKQKLMGRKDIDGPLKKILDDMLKEQEEQVHQVSSNIKEMNEYDDLEELPNFRTNLRDQVRMAQKPNIAEVGNKDTKAFKDAGTQTLETIEKDNEEELTRLEKEMRELWNKEQALEKSFNQYKPEQNLQNADQKLTESIPQTGDSNIQVHKGSQPMSEEMENHKSDGSRGRYRLFTTLDDKDYDFGKKVEDVTRNTANENSQILEISRPNEMTENPTTAHSLRKENENVEQPSEGESIGNFDKSKDSQWLMGKNNEKEFESEADNKGDVFESDPNLTVQQQDKKFGKGITKAGKVKDDLINRRLKINPFERKKLSSIGKEALDEPINKEGVEKLLERERGKLPSGNIQKISKKLPLKPDFKKLESKLPKTLNLRKLNQNLPETESNDKENDGVTEPDNQLGMTVGEEKVNDNRESDTFESLKSPKQPEQLQTKKEQVNPEGENNPDNVVQWLLNEKDKNNQKMVGWSEATNDAASQTMPKKSDESDISEKVSEPMERIDIEPEAVAKDGMRFSDLNDLTNGNEFPNQVSMTNPEAEKDRFPHKKNHETLADEKLTKQATSQEEDTLWEKIDDEILKGTKKFQQIKIPETDEMVENKSSFIQPDRPEMINDERDNLQLERSAIDEQTNSEETKYQDREESVEKEDSVQNEQVQKAFEENPTLIEDQMIEGMADDKNDRIEKATEGDEGLTNSKEFEMVQEALDNDLKSADLKKGRDLENTFSSAGEKTKETQETAGDAEDGLFSKYEKVRKMMDDSVRDAEIKNGELGGAHTDEDNLQAVYKGMENTEEELEGRVDEDMSPGYKDENVQEIRNDEEDVGNIQEGKYAEQYEDDKKYEDERMDERQRKKEKHSDMMEVDSKETHQMNDEEDENVQMPLKKIDDETFSDSDTESQRSLEDTDGMVRAMAKENEEREGMNNEQVEKTPPRKNKMDINSGGNENDGSADSENVTERQQKVMRKQMKDEMDSFMNIGDARPLESNEDGESVKMTNKYAGEMKNENPQKSEKQDGGEIDDYLKITNGQSPTEKDDMKPTVNINSQEEENQNFDIDEMVEKADTHEMAASTENELYDQRRKYADGRGQETTQFSMDNSENVAMENSLDENGADFVEMKTDRVSDVSKNEEAFDADGPNKAQVELNGNDERVSSEQTIMKEERQGFDESQEEKIASNTNEDEKVGSMSSRYTEQQDGFDEKEDEKPLNNMNEHDKVGSIRTVEAEEQDGFDESQEKRSSNNMDENEKIDSAATEKMGEQDVFDRNQDERVSSIINEDEKVSSATPEETVGRDGFDDPNPDERVSSTMDGDQNAKNPMGEVEDMTNTINEEGRVGSAHDDMSDLEKSTDPERLKMESMMNEREEESEMNQNDDQNESDSANEEILQLPANDNKLQNTENPSERIQNESIEKEEEVEEDRIALTRNEPEELMKDNVANQMRGDMPKQETAVSPIENADEIVEKSTDHKNKKDEADSGIYDENEETVKLEDELVKKIMNDEPEALPEEIITPENDKDGTEPETGNHFIASNDEMVARVQDEMRKVENIPDNYSTKDGDDKVEQIMGKPSQDTVESVEALDENENDVYYEGDRLQKTMKKSENAAEPDSSERYENNEDKADTGSANEDTVQRIMNFQKDLSDVTRSEPSDDDIESEKVRSTAGDNSDNNDETDVNDSEQGNDEIIGKKESDVLGHPSGVGKIVEQDKKDSTLSSEDQPLRNSHHSENESDQNDESNEIGGASNENLNNPVVGNTREMESEKINDNDEVVQSTKLKDDSFEVPDNNQKFGDRKTKVEDTNDQSLYDEENSETGPDDNSDDSGDWTTSRLKGEAELEELSKRIDEIFGENQEINNLEEKEGMKTKTPTTDFSKGQETSSPHPEQKRNWKPKGTEKQVRNDAEVPDFVTRKQWAKHPYEDDSMKYNDDPLLESENIPADYDLIDDSKETYPKLKAGKSRPFSSFDEEKLQHVDPKPKAQKLKMPMAIEKIMNDLNTGKEKDDISSLQSLDPGKIDHFIDRIDEAEIENLNQNLDADCKKECACVDDIDSRSRKIGRYEIVKDFLHWVKDLKMNRVLSDD